MWRRRPWAIWPTSCLCRRKSRRSFCRRPRTATRCSIPTPGRSRQRRWRRCPSAGSSPVTASAWTPSISTPPRRRASSSPTTRPLVLACARKVAVYDRLVRGGRWEVPPGKPMFRLSGRTLGLVGFGNIARQVARRAAAFGMRILFADPFVEEGRDDVPGKKTEFVDLLARADFLSLHPPLTPETRKMIGDEALSRMKPTAFVINCSRGPVIDTDALVRALDARKIAGCALDTIDPEPLPDPHPLRGRENVIVTPHVAWYSEQALVGLQAGAPAEVRRVLMGEWPLNVVNRAVKGRSRAGL
ncbi:MAG: hypothetical protein E6H53_10770 [Betaproteobacteria bacterium]|nr:MAG: hypothetical protein E6H53_10770 [Betaproteobacteria bacterium]